MPDTNLTPEQQNTQLKWEAAQQCHTNRDVRMCSTELLTIIDDLDKRLTEAEKFRADVLEWCKRLKDQANA